MATPAAPLDTVETPVNDAPRRVFETAELLEMILLELPLVDLFAVQRTSRFVKSTIAGSAKLQRQMWLIPDDTKVDLELNPLIEMAIYKPFLATERGTEDGISCGPDQRGSIHPEFHIVSENARKYQCTIPFELPEQAIKLRGCPVSHQSWQRMLLVQPPRNDVRCTLNTTLDVRGSFTKNYVCYMSKLNINSTMFELYDKLDGDYERFQNAYKNRIDARNRADKDEEERDAISDGFHVRYKEAKGVIKANTAEIRAREKRTIEAQIAKMDAENTATIKKTFAKPVGERLKSMRLNLRTLRREKLEAMKARTGDVEADEIVALQRQSCIQETRVRTFLKTWRIGS